MKLTYPLMQSFRRPAILILILLSVLTSLQAQTIFWSDNFDAPAGGPTFNNDGVGWSGSTATPGGGTNGSILGISDVWVIGATNSPANICVGTGNKLYIEAQGSGTANRYESDINTDKLDATPNISTVGVTGITMVFSWRCNGVAGSDYGLIGLSSNGGTTWNWLPTQYQGQSTCQLNDSIAIPNTYQGISNFKIAFRFISNSTSCSTCDPPFNVDNIQLIGTVASSGCPLTISGQTSTNPTCHGSNDGTITITATNGTGITYTINSGTPVSNSTGTFTGLAPGTYTVSVAETCTTNGTNIILTDPAAVPAPTATNNGPVCVGDTLKLFATTVASATYAWTGPNSFSVQNPVKSNAVLGDAGTYSVVATVGSCHSAAGTTTVVVNALPASPTAANNGPLCTGDTLKLTATTVGGATYSWTGPNNFSTQNPVKPNSAVGDAGTYSVVATVGNCHSAAATTLVVINLTPASPVAANNGPLCVGDSLKLTATTVAGATYSWTGPNNFNTQNPVKNPVAITDSGVYTVITTQGTCHSTPVTTDVVISPPPATPVAGNNGPACEGTSVQLTATNTGTSYTWTGPNNFSVQNPGIASVALSDAGTYTVVTHIGSCSSGSATTTLVVNPSPAAPVASNTGPVCAGDSIRLNASTVNGATYSWTGPNNFSVQNPSILVTTSADSGTYSVVATIGSCSSSAATTTAVVNPTPVAPIVTASDTVICLNDSAQICIPATFSTYAWNNNNSGTNCIYASQAGNYYVTVTDAHGCSVESANHLHLTVRSAPQISITQNGDTLTCNTTGTVQWYIGNTAITGATSNIYVAQQSGQYSVQLTDSNGCSAKSTAVSVTVVGIAAIVNELNFNIYPNPVSDQLTIDLGNFIPAPKMQIEIFDIAGRRVQQSKIESAVTKLNVANLNSGVYMIRIGSIVRKFVRE